jgi:hypothetical protein
MNVPAELQFLYRHLRLITFLAAQGRDSSGRACWFSDLSVFCAWAFYVGPSASLAFYFNYAAATLLRRLWFRFLRLQSSGGNPLG